MNRADLKYNVRIRSEHTFTYLSNLKLEKWTERISKY